MCLSSSILFIILLQLRVIMNGSSSPASSSIVFGYSSGLRRSRFTLVVVGISLCLHLWQVHLNTLFSLNLVYVLLSISEHFIWSQRSHSSQETALHMVFSHSFTANFAYVLSNIEFAGYLREVFEKLFCVKFSFSWAFISQASDLLTIVATHGF